LTSHSNTCWDLVWDKWTTRLAKEGRKEQQKQNVVKKKWLEVRATQVAEVIIDRVDLLGKIRSLETKDNEVVKAVEEMK